MIPREFIDGAKPEDIAKVIYDTLMYFAQILAYTISSTKPNEYIFGLYGNERTGKSFFVSIVKKLIGVQFCSERSIEEMNNNRFAISSLWGKKVYIEPDLKTRQSLPEAFIKAHAGETITTIEAKNKDAVDGVKMSLAMYFGSNYEFYVHGN
jgi:phage/plasmid-associated DNA primase